MKRKLALPAAPESKTNNNSSAKSRLKTNQQKSFSFHKLTQSKTLSHLTPPSTNSGRNSSSKKEQPIEVENETDSEILCQICGMHLEFLDFQKRNEHMNECLDKMSSSTTTPLPKSRPRKKNDENNNDPRLSNADDSGNDFAESSPFQKKLLLANKKLKVLHENGHVQFATSSSTTSSTSSTSTLLETASSSSSFLGSSTISSSATSLETIEQQISRCRSRLIEIEGQLSECYYQRVQVNKEIKKLLKKQSLESQNILGNTSNTVLIPPKPVEEMINLAFDSNKSGDSIQVQELQCEPVVESLEHPLWSLSHQSTLFDNVIANSETSTNGLLSVKSTHKVPENVPEPSLFTQLESAALEVCEAKSPVTSDKLPLIQPCLLDQFEGLLNLINSEIINDKLVAPEWKEIQRNLESSIQTISTLLKHQPSDLESAELTPIPTVDTTHTDTHSHSHSHSQSFVLSQSVVIVSDSDEVPSQQKPPPPTQRIILAEEGENDQEVLHITIEDSPVLWRLNPSSPVDLISPLHSPISSLYDITSNQIDTAEFPYLTPLPLQPSPSPPSPLTPPPSPPPSLSTTDNSSIRVIPLLSEVPLFSEFSLEKLQSTCRSYGLKQSENSASMIKLLTSLWTRHHHPSSSQVSSQLPPTESETVAVDSHLDLSDYKKTIKDYLRNDEEFYSMILSFQSIDLEKFKSRLKDHGIIIPKQILRDILDQEGVFVTSN